MEFETKYNINDKVWCWYKNKVMEFTIYSIKICTIKFYDVEKYDELYILMNDSITERITKNINELFLTKEELLKTL